VEIKVFYRNKEWKLENISTVRDVLKQLNVNPQTVLVAVEGELVTEDHILKNGDTVTLIDVISGG
jgi:sulfur carrier protein ThiS